MDTEDQAEEPGSEILRTKKIIDSLMPLALVILSAYLYLEFSASSSNQFQQYKSVLQYSILAFFSAELLVDFMIYEKHRKFFQGKWLDIIPTMPFLTAFRGLMGLKIIKAAKAGKLLKTGKIAQEAGKLYTKIEDFLRRSSKTEKGGVRTS